MQLRDLLDNPDLRVGLGVGIVVLVALLPLLARAQRNPTPAQSGGTRPGGRAPRRAEPVRVPPLAGIATVVAAVVALVAEGGQALGSTRLIVGLVLLVVGPFAAAVALGNTGAPAAFTMLAAVPGAAVVAWATTAANDLGWTPWLVFATTLGGGALVADFDRANARAGLGPVLLAIAALGMYSTLPDTEQVAVLVGITLPLVLLGTPFAWASFGPGSYGVVGLVAWVAAVGGRGRPGSVVAAIACLGLMLVEPFVRRVLRGHLHPLQSPRSAVVAGIIVVQVAVVLVIARAAGLRTSARSATAISALVLLLGAAALAALLAARGARPAPRAASDDRRDRSAS